MKRNHLLVFQSLLLAGAFALTCSTLIAQTRESPNEIKTGIITLYARDPLAQSFCFRDGTYGAVFQESEVRNRCSDINFNGYRADSLSIGVEGARQGVIIDLGTPDELQKRYGYAETVGGGQAFASLRVKDRKIHVLLDRRAHTSQEVSDTNLLFQKPSSDTKSMPAKLGQIYLVRLTDRNEKDFELLVKLLVIAHVPNEFVTVRWQVL